MVKISHESHCSRQVARNAHKLFYDDIHEESALNGI